jgi:WD40 repeat protein
MRGVRFTRDMRRLYACNMGTYTRTDCQSWTVSLHVADRPAPTSVPPRAAQVTLPVTGGVVEIAIGSVSNAIDLGSSRLKLAAEGERLGFMNNGSIRFIGDSSAANAERQRAATVFENAAVSSDGRLVTAELADQQLAVFDLRTGALLSVIDLANYTSNHVFLSDGTLALDWGREGIRIVKPETGAHLHTLRYPPQGNVSVLAASARTPLMVVGSSEGTLSFGRADTPAVAFRTVERAHRGAVVSAAFSPDGRLVASGGLDGRIRLFEVRTGTPVGDPWAAHTRAVTAISFNADAGLLASGSTDGTVRVWNVTTGQPVTEALVSHTEPVLAITFDPSTGQVLSFGRDHKLRSWNLPSAPGALRGSN